MSTVNFKGCYPSPPLYLAWRPRKKELDLNGFLALRANSGFMEGAAQVGGWGGDDDEKKSLGCHIKYILLKTWEVV